MKFLLIFIFLLFFVSFVSATKLGVSPGNLIFNGSMNEKICNNLTINTDYNGILIGESRWIEKVKEKREIKDYDLNTDDLNINIVFPERINITKANEIIEVCISAKKSGKYNGAILYKTADSYAGVGSWIEVNIDNISNNNQNSEFGFEKISGAAVYVIPKQYSVLSIILTISIMALFIIFIALFIVYKKKK